MDTITNALKLAALIIAAVYGFRWLSRYCKNMMVKTAALDVEAWVRRIEEDMKHCSTLESLDRLEKQGDLVIAKAKTMIPDTKPYAERILRAYNNKHWDLVNDFTRPGIPQSLIPFLTIR